MKLGNHAITKKEVGKVFLAAVLVCLCIFTIVKVRSYARNRGVGFPDTYLLAAFDTTADVNSGTLIYYDEDFKEVFRQDIPMGDSCDSSNPPIVYGDKVYVAPGGQWFRADVEEVLEIDRLTGKQKKYKTGQKRVEGMAVTEDYIFTVSNSKNAVLARISKQDGSIQELEYKNAFSDQVNVYGQYVYCFIESRDEQTRCSILDIDTMEEVKSFDITDYGKAPEYTYRKDGILYLPISSVNDGGDCGFLLMYDTETGELNSIDLDHELPLQILEYEGKLVVTHTALFNPNRGEHSVSIYDPETGQLENYTAESTLDQAAIKDDLLYALDTQEQTIFIYDMRSSGGALELKGSYKLKSKEGSSLNTYFTGGFFMR